MTASVAGWAAAHLCNNCPFSELYALLLEIPEGSTDEAREQPLGKLPKANRIALQSLTKIYSATRGKLHLVSWAVDQEFT